MGCRIPIFQSQGNAGHSGFPVRLVCGLLVAVTIFAVTTPARADNTIDILPIEVITNTTGVVIPIRIVNDTALMGLVEPLVIRSTSGGAFITAVKGSFADRLPPGGALADIVFVNHYTAENGACKSGQPGGFVASAVFTDTNSHPVSASPYGLLFSRFRTVSPNLAAGVDVSGSLVLTVDINNLAGTFEIDTTCIDPTNHQYWVEYGPFIKNGIPATFTKGVVTVLACDCSFACDFDGDSFSTALDLGSLIDILFAGGSDIQDKTCPTTRADFDCDGFATALDLGGLVDYLFAGSSPPCDRCLQGLAPVR